MYSGFDWKGWNDLLHPSTFKSHIQMRNWFSWNFSFVYANTKSICQYNALLRPWTNLLFLSEFQMLWSSLVSKKIKTIFWLKNNWIKSVTMMLVLIKCPIKYLIVYEIPSTELAHLFTHSLKLSPWFLPWPASAPSSLSASPLPPLCHSAQQCHRL